MSAVPECCYGVEMGDDRTVVVAELVHGKPTVTARYAGDEAGIAALSRHVARGDRKRICIHACGAAALAIALGLTTLPRSEVMLVGNVALQPRPGYGGDIPASPDARAERLAVLAKRML